MVDSGTHAPLTMIRAKRSLVVAAPFAFSLAAVVGTRVPATGIAVSGVEIAADRIATA